MREQILVVNSFLRSYIQFLRVRLRVNCVSKSCIFKIFRVCIVHVVENFRINFVHCKICVHFCVIENYCLIVILIKYSEFLGIYQTVSYLFCGVEYNTVSKLTFSEEQLSRFRQIRAPRSRRVLCEARRLAGGHSS